MGKRLLDTYEKWEQQGILKKKLKDVKELVAKNITQKRIAEYLGMTEKTLIKLKKKHKKLEKAFIYGNDELLETLMSTILKKAKGYTIPLQQKIMEDNKSAKNSKKTKIVIQEKHYPPDLNAAKYILVLKFGKKYNDKRKELDLMKERINKEEMWNDASNPEKDNWFNWIW